MNTDLYLYYSSATEPGSSGSPILKEVEGELKLVGLHRAGNTESNWGSLFSEIVNKTKGNPLNPSKWATIKLITAIATIS